MEPVDLDPSTLGLHSCEGNDSNLILLPERKKKKEKNKEKLKPKLNPRLSKSQKRKLKKIEEEKEKEILLAQSIEALEKYKIRDELYPLMLSSRNLGQVETVREKRRREIEYSKAGLEVPYNVRPPKIRHIHNTSSYVDNEPDSDSDSTQPSTIMKEIIPKLPPVLEADDKKRKDTCEQQVSSVSDIPETVVIDKSNVSSTQDSTKSLLLSGTSSIQEEVTKPKDKVEEMKQITPTIVHVSRPVEVEDKRKDLPIVMMEQEIMEAINYNSSVIICGETGCGKTTQVPQFLYEAGFGSNKCEARSGIIGVTQPRRVAVLATAKRVAYELGFHLGNEVGFQVRHDRRVGSNCSIKFMTDGILLKELQNDFLLKRYSVLILDEAHERSLNTDILIGMLSRIVRERQSEYEKQKGENIDPKDKIFPLKLILMSATLRVDDFTSGKRIFPVSPPIIIVPTRQYPVTTYFSKTTERVDYIGQAYKKVMAIHKKLPPGGILVFVTGQREVEFLCRKLRQTNNINSSSVLSEGPTKENDIKEISDAFEIQENERFSDYDNDNDDYKDLSDNESDSPNDLEEESDLEFNDNNEDSLDLGTDSSLVSLKAAFESLTGKKKEPSEINTNEVKVGPIRALPLYAMLPASAQLSVFDEVKEGERLVVVATNVAETSLTIPGIKYVVDTGRVKVKNYNRKNGIETYEVQWISKASAAQRAGRAGRTGPGHCYRLYSPAGFTNEFPDFSIAEISKIPVDGVVLLMKSMNISKVENFPFPTPPETSAIIEAEDCLKALEALDEKGRLTSLGKAMAQYPMSPRHSRMLLTVIQIIRNLKDSINPNRANLVLAYAVSVAAALSLSNPFTMQSDDNTSESNHDDDNKEEKLRKKKLKKQIVEASRGKFSNPTSDYLTTAYALQCFELEKNTYEFCNSYGLHIKTMEEMSKLRKQLLNLVFASKFIDSHQEFVWTHGSIEDVESAWRRVISESEKQPLKLYEEEILGQGICAGWADRVAKRTKEGDRKVNAVRYQACMVDETVYLHRWSSLSKSAPEFLVYNELLETKRPYMHGVTRVKTDWLVKYAQSLCTFTDITHYYYDRTTDQILAAAIPAFGRYLWEFPRQGVPIDKIPNLKKKSERFDISVKVFAHSLLKGEVVSCIKSYKECMLTLPGSFLKVESLGLKRVGNLVNKLHDKKIISCDMLRKVWEDDHMELYSEIKDWFHKESHVVFDKVWLDMQREVRVPKETKGRIESL